MDIERYNAYEHLRDFKVPATVLDNIFSTEEDQQVLMEAWNALIQDGYSQDETAKKIAELIFQDLDIDPNHSSDVEK